MALWGACLHWQGVEYGSCHKYNKMLNEKPPYEKYIKGHLRRMHTSFFVIWCSIAWTFAIVFIAKKKKKKLSYF